MNNNPGPKEFMKHVVEQTRYGYTCNRPPGAAGAAIVTDATTLYTGVFPSNGSPTCKEVGCEIEYSIDVISIAENPSLSEMTEYIHPHCIRTIHAEQRLITECARQGIRTEGATVYSILKPCYQCTKILIAAGVSNIFYASRAYDEERTQKILKNAGVQCTHVDIGLDYGF